MAQQVKENQKVINDLIEEKEKREIAFLEIISNRKKVRIPYDEIIYIESLADYIMIYTDNNEVRSKMKISAISKELPDLFVRIHRSFIVNKEKVTAIRSGELEIGEKVFTISRSYQKEVRERLKKLHNKVVRI